MYFIAIPGIRELGSMVICLEANIPFSSYNIINTVYFAGSPGITPAICHEESNTILLTKPKSSKIL